MSGRASIDSRLLLVGLLAFAPSIAHACKCTEFTEEYASTVEALKQVEDATVVRARVTRMVASKVPVGAGRTWNVITLEIEILESLKGTERRRRLTVGGTGGCNIDLKQFPEGTDWYFAMHPAREEIIARQKAKAPTLPRWDYELWKCGGFARRADPPDAG